MGCISSKNNHEHVDLAGESTEHRRPDAARDQPKPPAYEPADDKERLNLHTAVERVLTAAEMMKNDLHAITIIVEVGAEGHDEQTAAKIHATLTVRTAALRGLGNGSNADRLARPVLDALREQMAAPEIRPYYLAQLSLAAGRATTRIAAAREEEE